MINALYQPVLNHLELIKVEVRALRFGIWDWLKFLWKTC